MVSDVDTEVSASSPTRNRTARNRANDALDAETDTETEATPTSRRQAANANVNGSEGSGSPQLRVQHDYATLQADRRQASRVPVKLRTKRLDRQGRWRNAYGEFCAARTSCRTLFLLKSPWKGTLQTSKLLEGKDPNSFLPEDGSLICPPGK